MLTAMETPETIDHMRTLKGTIRATAIAYSAVP